MRGAGLPLMTFLVACGGIVVRPDDGAGGAGAALGSRSASSMSSSSTLASPAASTSSSGGESCAPDAKGITSCCNGSPCLGWCDANHGCVCNSIMGGCAAPTVCCNDTCTAPEQCQGL
jgi:hypothetical protein